MLAFQALLPQAQKRGEEETSSDGDYMDQGITWIKKKRNKTYMLIHILLWPYNPLPGSVSSVSSFDLCASAPML
jgi:hypothetical protein